MKCNVLAKCVNILFLHQEVVYTGTWCKQCAIIHLCYNVCKFYFIKGLTLAYIWHICLLYFVKNVSRIFNLPCLPVLSLLIYVITLASMIFAKAVFMYWFKFENKCFVCNCERVSSFNPNTFVTMNYFAECYHHYNDLSFIHLLILSVFT